MENMPTLDHTLEALRGWRGGPIADVHDVLQFFRYAHLPADLQARSKLFADLAVVLACGPKNPETVVALRKLLEAKDAAVRATIYRVGG